MKRFMITVLAATAVMTVLTGCKIEYKGAKETEKTTEAVTEAAAEAETEAKAEVPVEVTNVEIAIKDYGTIKAELYPEVAPITVANFVKLVNDKFYDGLTFHRIIDGFMIQGGDPLGNGMGGSDEKIKGEFSANGVENDLLHTRGVLSMARAQDMNSASSQFFIMHQDASYLDGQYAAFGKVTEGIEIVDKICEETPVIDGNGSVDPKDQPVIESIVIIE